MGTASLATAVRASPLLFLTSRWPYRAAAFVALVIVLTPLGVLAASSVLLLPAWGAVLASVDRRAVMLVGRDRIPDARLRLPYVKFWDRARARLAEPITWRESGYALIHVLVGVASFAVLGFVMTFVATGALVPVVLGFTAIVGEPGPLGESSFGALAWAIPLTVVSLAILLYLVSGIALGLSVIATNLLSPRPEALQKQVAQLARSNALTQDAFDESLRDLERQIHDGAQIRISTAAMHLGLLDLRLRGLNGPDEALQECVELLSAARSENEKSMDALRESMQGLRPRILQEAGLVAAIEDATSALPLRTTVSGSGTHRMPVGIEYSLLQIAKEAVTNVAKHAKATSVVVAVAATDDAVELTIQDDGRGGANPFIGTGIIGMQERAQLLGGVFRLSSPTGGPTILTVSVPLADRLSLEEPVTR